MFTHQNPNLSSSFFLRPLWKKNLRWWLFDVWITLKVKLINDSTCPGRVLVAAADFHRCDGSPILRRDKRSPEQRPTRKKHGVFFRYTTSWYGEPELNVWTFTAKSWGKKNMMKWSWFLSEFVIRISPGGVKCNAFGREVAATKRKNNKTHGVNYKMDIRQKHLHYQMQSRSWPVGGASKLGTKMN